MPSKFHGIGVALVTPFFEGGKVDFVSLGNLIDHVSKHVDYLVVCGTTGEAATLEQEERLQILDFVIKNNSKKLPIVFGLGGNNTREVINALTHIPSSVDAILSVSPAYIKPSQQGIIDHYNAISEASSKSVILYNVPGRTSTNLTWQTTLELAKHPNIIGIKEASGDIVQSMHIMSRKPEDFLLISGDDMLTPALLSIGAVGVISVLSNAFPYHFSQLYKSKTNGLFFELLEMNLLMYEEGNPVGIKEVLRQINVCSHYVRLPLVHASDNLSSRINETLKSISKN